MPSIRETIFKAYAVQAGSKSIEAKLAVEVKDPNKAHFDNKLKGIYKLDVKKEEDQATADARIKEALSTYKPCGLYKEVGSSRVDPDMQMVKGLEAGHVMSAVGKLQGHQQAWVEWAYTHLGGTVADFKKMLMASGSIKHLENMLQNARATYELTEDAVVKVMIASLEKYISSLRAKGGSGMEAGGEFFRWLDNQLKDRLQGKQERVVKIVRKLALVAAFNYSRQAMCSDGPAPVTNESMYRLVGISPVQYCKDYKVYYEYVLLLCARLDSQALPLVASKVLGKKLAGVA